MKKLVILVLALMLFISSCAVEKPAEEKPMIIEEPAFVPPAEEPGAPAEEIAQQPGQQAVPEKEDEIVVLKDTSADPFNLIVTKDTKVTFINQGGNVHRVRINETLFLSERLYPGDSFSYVFDELGDYSYRSVWSGPVRGTITVVKTKEMITGRVPTSINFDREGFFDILNVLIMCVLVGMVASYVTSKKYNS